MLNKVAAVIVTYNRKMLLGECLDALKRQSYPDLDVYVIDNGSTDGTLASIEPLLENPNYFYYNTWENLGGGRRLPFRYKNCC